MALFSLSPIFLMTLVTHDTHDHIKIIFKKNEKSLQIIREPQFRCRIFAADLIKDFSDYCQTVARLFETGQTNAHAADTQESRDNIQD